MRRVLHHFAMPAVHEMADGTDRVAAIKALRVFDDEMYFRDVYQPILAALGVSRPELRRGAAPPPAAAGVNGLVLPAPPVRQAA